jgi:hypothetical protein
LQQSALEAHDPPSLMQLPKAHRGMPRLSWMHVFAWQLPAQQSHVSLHEFELSLQTSPLGLHPEGNRHVPTVLPGLMVQVTAFIEPPAIPAAPQQSSSLTQRSPTG